MTTPGDRSTPAGPFREIQEHGQRVWLRGLRRRLVDSGRLAELMSECAVTGVTGDLTALAGALSRGGEYAEALARVTADDKGAAGDLLAEEAAHAAPLLLPRYEQSEGSDGIICVAADLATASDAEAMARSARRLLTAAAAPNVMVRLPPTDAGLAVFETLVADRLHVCLGPVYTVDAVARATEAYLSATGGDERYTAPFAAVLFGVAPIDGLVDQLLHREIRSGGGDTSGVESLLGGAAVAVAKMAWRRQRELLAARGALADARLRLAWTDLTPIDPRQTREHYVERLVGPGTVTLLDSTLLGSVRRRGEIDATLGRHIDEAEELLAEIAELDIDVRQIGAALEAKSLRQARARYARLSRTIAAAAATLADDPEGGQRRAATGTRWVAGAVEVDERPASCEELEERRAVTRMWEKDGSLWASEDAVIDLARNRLGWLDVAAAPAAAEEPLVAFAAELEAAEVEDIILIGTGGSSLISEVACNVFESDRLRVLDSTVPAQIETVGARVDPARTAIVVASKSGTTLEVRSLFDWFYARATPMLDNPGERFAAITDPGTPLEQLAHERRFDRLWLAPADVGGRYAALTVFGALPMALMGIDVAEVWAAARRMAAACQPEVDTAANPAARLAAALCDAWRDGRDKLTLIIAPSLAAFGPWVEQLVAESTGKQGRGLVPVIDEPGGAADDYADDRVFVSLVLAGEEDTEHERRLEEIESAGHPLIRCELEDRHDIGGELFRWQAAVALLGALMGINPFDQPDVQASKDRTEALLAAQDQGDEVSDRPPLDTDSGWAVFADLEHDDELSRRRGGEGLEGWLAAHIGRAEPPDYVALQAFLPVQPEIYETLQAVRRLVFERRRVATTLGWGPRFLHSTGQLHKGGPATGLFLQLTADSGEDIEVPGAGYTFGDLVRAQWLGDLAALQERGRRVLRVHLREAVAGCEMLLAALDRAIE
ncbi:MAG: bifunctional transaldolase/phosoglucose isomerase [Acidobacteriota bacterium]